MSRHRNAEAASSALRLLILANILVHAFRQDFRQHLNLSRTFRIYDGDLLSMILSIFYHIEPTHLLINMLALHKYGTELFVNSSSRTWRNFLTTLVSYVACGLGAFAGISLLSYYHDYQWRQKISDARRASRCTHWLCDLLNNFVGEDILSQFTNAWADWTMMFQHVDVQFSMWHFVMIHRIGASGVVYGWMGMRLVTSLLSPYHSKLDGLDYFFLMGTLAHDFSKSPISLEGLRVSTFLEGDGVDHAAHFLGAMFGIAWAFAFILWDRLSNWRFGWGFGWSWGRRWRGEGRRLGGLTEEERSAQERLWQQQDQQRRQQSRLLKARARGQRLRTRSRERTML